MFVDAVERLYAYQRESSNHLFKVSQAVSYRDFSDVIVVGQPSIRDTSFRMVEVIDNHFAWWNFVEDLLAPGLNYRNSSDFNNP